MIQQILTKIQLKLFHDIKKYDLDVNLKIEVGNNTNNLKKFIHKVKKNLKKLGSKTIFGIMIHDTKTLLKLTKKNNPK